MNRYLEAMLLFGLTACADTTPGHLQRLFEPSGLALQLPTEIVYEWRFDTELTWTPIDGTPFRLLADEKPGGLWIGWRDGQATLEIASDLEADEIDALEVELAYPHSSGLELAWQREGDAQAYLPSQTVTLDADDKRIFEGNATYRFQLRDLPTWRGAIRLLRLRVRTAGGDGRALLAITALQLSLPGSLWSEWAATPWRIELDHEVRDAFLTPPGGTRRHEVVVPPGSSLELGFGALGVTRQALSFRVYAEQDALRKELLRSELPAGMPPTWTDRTIELQGLAGPMRLVFEAHGEDSLDLRTGLPVWSIPMIESPTTAGSRGPDVVLISIDTLRADRLEGSDGSSPVAGAIAEWGRRHAVRFANPIVQAAWTLPSHSSMLTGLEPSHHGVNHPRAFLPPTFSTLAEELRRAGYHTRAVTGGGWLHPRFGLDQGFDRFRFWPTSEDDDELVQGVRYALESLEESNRPLFLFLHTFAVHEYWRTLPNGPRTTDSHVRAQRYDDAVARADRLLKPLLERTSDLARERPVILILTSDHGESLGDPFSPGHNEPVEATIRVPLLIQLPSRAGAGAVITDQVRTIDLLPTILDLVGADSATQIDGTSLLPLLDRRSPSGQRQAWTYSSAGDAGLSLRIGNRWKYRFGNAAGHPTAGRGQLWRLDGTGGEERIETQAHRLGVLEDLARAWLAEISGLSIEVSAPGGPITLQLDGLGHVLDNHAVTSLDLPSGSLSRLAPDGLALEIPGGGPYTVVIENLVQSSLAIAIGDSDGASWRRVFDLTDPTLDLQLEVSADGWRPIDRAMPPQLRIRWQNVHPSFATSRSIPGIDPELNRRLESLGYLE